VTENVFLRRALEAQGLGRFSQLDVEDIPGGRVRLEMDVRDAERLDAVNVKRATDEAYDTGHEEGVEEGRAAGHRKGFDEGVLLVVDMLADHLTKVDDEPLEHRIRTMTRSLAKTYGTGEYAKGIASRLRSAVMAEVELAVSDPEVVDVETGEHL
jgi:flagellar biosynthesis/type III secretory pathway protein FliH